MKRRTRGLDRLRLARKNREAQTVEVYTQMLQSMESQWQQTRIQRDGLGRELERLQRFLTSPIARARINDSQYRMAQFIFDKIAKRLKAEVLEMPENGDMLLEIRAPSFTDRTLISRQEINYANGTIPIEERSAKCFVFDLDPEATRRDRMQRKW